jgi:phosphotransferase system HPr (HPr) family protein
MGVMMLAAEMGSKIKIVAKGTDAHGAIQALGQLINDKFGEE